MCDYCNGWEIHATTAYINYPPDGEKTVDLLFNYCPNCGRPLKGPEPLTKRDIKTLGAKSGKPLWVQIIPDNLWQSRWVIIGHAIQTQDLTDVGIELGAFGNHMSFYYNDYGKTWLAYSRRPEGVRLNEPGGESGS